MIRTRGPRGPAGTGAAIPTGTGYRHVTAGVEDAASSTPTTVALDLVASRRAAASATTRLLWECQGAAGAIANSGSLGAAGDLTAGGALGRAVLPPQSTIGRGVRCTGAATSEASGAAGQTPGTTTAVTVWALVTVDATPSGKSVICRDSAAAGWGASPTAAAIFTDAAGMRGTWSLTAALPVPGTYQDVDTGAVLTWEVGRQYLLGSTYDGATMRLWRDGVLLASEAFAGEIDWGDPAAPWHLGSNGNAELATQTVLRAGVEAEVWDADRWALEVARYRGHGTT